ncbi:3750_t:CDS:2 [Rhizophagus irregularis]|nr:3750_t:CDS:2 [Rhizophagus irregularis]
MIVINGPVYRKLLCGGYIHWREERLLIPPLHELPILRRYLSFISYRIWNIVSERSLLAVEAISSRQLRDPGKPGSTYLSSFLKKEEYIPKPYEPLLPSSLRKLGAVFALVVHGPKNPSKANTYASEALRHSPNNHASPSDRYTIVNFRRRGQPYDQAKPFWISDEN